MCDVEPLILLDKSEIQLWLCKVRNICCNFYTSEDATALMLYDKYNIISEKTNLTRDKVSAVGGIICDQGLEFNKSHRFTGTTSQILAQIKQFLKQTLVVNREIQNIYLRGHNALRNFKPGVFDTDTLINTADTVIKMLATKYKKRKHIDMRHKVYDVVCEAYSMCAKYMCDLAGLPCLVVPMYNKDKGSLINHSINLIILKKNKIDYCDQVLAIDFLNDIAAITDEQFDKMKKHSA